MKEVFNIGIVKGVFDIFIPGAFLLINLLGAWMVLPKEIFGLPDGEPPFDKLANNPLLGTVAFVCFSYLAGMVLRLTKVKTADRLSARVNRFFGHKRLGIKKEHLIERFPYFEYIKDIAKDKLPSDALTFYNDYWQDRNPAIHAKEKDDNRNFFNFCKTIINSIDARSAAEANTAEALSRYVASMFYALLFSVLVIVLASTGRVYSWYLDPGISFSPFPKFLAEAWDRLLIPGALIFFYLFAMIWILFNLRLLRFKEVEALFAATFLNRAEVVKHLNDPPIKEEAKPVNPGGAAPNSSPSPCPALEALIRRLPCQSGAGSSQANGPEIPPPS